MWKHIRSWLARLRPGLRESPADRRTARARARFWAQVHEGRREAEARSRS